MLRFPEASQAHDLITDIAAYFLFSILFVFASTVLCVCARERM